MIYALIAGIIIVTILIALNIIKSKYIPLCLYLITLGLMLSASMVGAHVIGSDMHQEYYISTQSLQNGWDYTASYGSQSSTSFIVGWFVPTLSRLLHIDIVWIYKLVLPAIFSFTPVVLYWVFKKQTLSTIGAYLAGLFFMIMPVATLEIVQIGKAMVAEVFLALLILAMVSNIRFKFWVMLGSLLVCIFAHYTVGLMAISYLICILIVRLVTFRFKKWSLFNNGKVSILSLVGVIVITIILAYSFYSRADGGTIVNVVSGVAPSYSGNGDLNGRYTGLGYLVEQSPLIKTAIGMDFMQVGLLGKIFRVIQYLTQLLILIGAVYLLFNAKKFKFTAEFLAGIGASFGLLLLCIFVPHFSVIINMTRFYHIALFFLSPLVFIGGMFLFRNKIAVAGTLIAYFIFTSGLAFELTKSNNINTFEVPYGIGLSAQRTGVVATYTQDDVNAAKWITSQDSKLKIVGDYNGYRLMMSFVRLERLKADEYKEIYGYGLEFTNMPEHCYILVTSWDVKNDKYITDIRDVWEAVGLRQSLHLPDFDYPVVYRSGDTIVYEK